MNLKNKVIYQIWPRSFYDSNGDGIGDIQGIIAKLEYVSGLGIDMIWLSPIYKSPNHDYGYDIQNYYQINEEYGTMNDFELLLKECKARNIQLIMDLVANHTSDQHPWFQEAIKDKQSKYRDYYYFSKQPNNWLSFFGGSSWQLDKASNEYYLTQFTPNQCDLNWNNPDVRHAIYDVMRFYLNKGVAGFRMDVINTIDKIDGLRDKNPNKKGLQFPADYTIDRPNVAVWLDEMHEQVIVPYDCIAIGECVLVTKESAIVYTKPEYKRLNMTFHFDLMLLGCGKLGKFDFRKGYHFSIKTMKQVIGSWQTAMIEGGGYVGNYLSNHDNPRQVSRFGDTKLYHKESAKCLALLNHTLYGTPFVYQGEEIGMTNHSFKQQEWRDYEATSVFQTLQTMMHLPKALARSIVNKMTRDHARTPMQWSSESYGGFSTRTPWIVVNPNHQTINVQTDKESKDSIYTFYQQLIFFRKQHIALQEGNFEELFASHRQVFGFIRTHPQESLLVLINLSKKSASIEFSTKLVGEFLFSTYPGKKKLTEYMVLIPYEAMVYHIPTIMNETN